MTNLFYLFLGYSYCGAQIFEIYGLGKEVVDLAFCGSISCIGGLTFDEVRVMENLKMVADWTLLPSCI